MRFYSDHNTASTLGNQSVDGTVEIADMRVPVLEVNAHATGTLETIRQFSANSPIANIFGGQLDRFKVEGEASFDLQLRYPIKDKLAYTFSASIRTNNGRLEIDGFAPPVTELTGLVSVTRDTIQSEGLTARFLGEPVSIDLTHAAEDMPKYAAVATATGTATADAPTRTRPPLSRLAEDCADRSDRGLRFHRRHFPAESTFPYQRPAACPPQNHKALPANQQLALPQAR